MPNAYIDPILGSDYWNGLQWTPANEQYAPYKIIWFGAAYGNTQSFGDVASTGVTWEQQLEVYSGDVLWAMNITDGQFSGANFAAGLYNPNPPVAASTLGVSATLKGAVMITLKPAGTTPVADISSYTAPAGETDQSITLSAPAGISDNDIMLAWILANCSSGGSPTITAPAGWALVGTVTATNTRLSLYWKRCSSESGDYTWSHDKATTAKIMGVITAYRNCIAAGNPYDAVSATNYTTSNTTCQAAAISTGTKLAGPKANAASAETDYAFAGGDTIKFRQSYHASATVGMTKGSLNITLPANSVKRIDDCESGWVQSANITVAHGTAYAVQGTNALKITPASGFTTGKMAYKQLPSTLDLSGYKAITFWAYLATVAAGAANDAIRICLCTDNTGDTPVASFDVNGRSRYGYNNENQNGSYTANQPWYCDLNAAIGSGINSIAIYAITDPGTTAIYFDNFCACGSVLAEDVVFCHDALIKEGDGLPIYVIKSFSADDTAVIVADHASAGCYKTDASVDVEVYIPLLMDTVTGITTYGTLGNLLTLSGGWNPDTDTRDGITYINNRNASGLSATPYWTVKQYIKVEHFGITYPVNGMSMQGALGCVFDDLYSTRAASSIAGMGNIATNLYSVGQGNWGFSGTAYGGSGAFLRNRIDGIYSSCCQYGLYIQSACKDTDFYNLKSWYCTRAFLSTYDCSLINIRNIEIYNPITYALYIQGGTEVKFYKLTIDTVPAAGIVYGLAEGNEQFFKIAIYDLTVDSMAVPYSTGISDDDSWIINMVRINDDPDDNRFYFDKGSMVTQKTTRHTAEGTALQFTVRSGVTLTTAYPKRIPLGVYYLPTGESNISVWVRKDDASCGTTIIIPAYQIQETTPTDKTDTMTVGANEWEKLLLTITTLEPGIVEMYADVWGAAGKSVFFDDIEIT
jgi:hypothetical protein